MKSFLRNNWSEMVIGVILLLVIIPQTRFPIQVFIQRLISFSPKEVIKEEQRKLNDYKLQFSDSENNTFVLEDDKGKVVLINFWATWCPPCIAEMPELSKIYKDYKDKVVFYFITQDDWGVINQFELKRKYGLPYYKLIRPSVDLDYTSLPTTYLIDKKGNILIEKVGVADWNSKEFRSVLDKVLIE